MLKNSVFNYFCYYDDERVIVFNKLYGSISVLEKYVANSIKNNTLHFLSKNVLEELQDAGFLTDLENEFSFAEELYTSNQKDSPDLHVTIEMTQNCNFKCSYCYQNEYRASGSIKSETFDALYQYIRRVIESNIRPISKIYFNVMGGEPLLLKDKVLLFSKKIRKFAVENGLDFSFGINTNGVFLDEVTIHEVDRLCVAITNIEDHDKLRVYKKDGAGSFNDIIRTQDLITPESSLFEGTAT